MQIEERSPKKLSYKCKYYFSGSNWKCNKNEFSTNSKTKTELRKQQLISWIGKYQFIQMLKSIKIKFHKIMGNSSSHTHEPLERGFTRGGKFGDVKNSVRKPKSLEYSNDGLFYNILF